MTAGEASENVEMSAPSGMAARVTAVDWSATPLGPAEQWPQSLQTALSVCLSSRFPLLVWWGPQLTVFYNDAYLPLLGTKHPSALGRAAADIWSEAWHDLGPLAERVMSGGDATFDEDRLLFLQRHGYLEETYWTFSYSPVHDESGGVGGVFVAVSDTTNRVIGERRLRVLRDLGEVSGASAGTAAGACQVAVEVLGRHRASVPFALAYVRDADDDLRLVAATGVRRGSAVAPALLPPDSRWRRTDGEPIVGLRELEDDWFEPGPLGPAVPDQALVFPLTHAGEADPIGLLVLGVNPYRELDRDYRSFFGLTAGHVSTAVTDALAYQAERRRAEALAELDRAKTDFFSNVSHEFRTPLTLIQGPLAELRSLPEVGQHARLREELDVISRNAERLGKLVNTLLDFSRLQSGRIDARFEAVDLAAFTAELASVFRSAVARAGLEFTVDCPPLPAPVHVDREMWERVVLNLLSNAVKHTFTGGIAVRLYAATDGAVLTVSDTGTGIPPEELPRLFERFHRVPHARGRSGEGSGIGLAMVRQLVELHGGAVTAESALGEGSTFTVWLPWGSAHLPAEQLADAPGAATVSLAVEPFLAEALRWLPAEDRTPGGDGSTAGAGAAAEGRILVADDNADMREYLRRLLSPRHRVETAADGASALARALGNPPDLVVADVMMPGMDGMQLLAALRADARTTRVPVVLLSARAGQDAAVEGLTAGADDYLVKPFAAGELLARVDAHLQLGRVRRRAEERFRAMADLAPALIWAAQPDGARTFLNAGWQQFTGHAAEDLGQGWQAGLHPEDRDRYLDTVEAARATGSGWEIEFRLRRADGAYHWLLERATPIGTGEGLAGFVGSCTDINARYRESERQALLASVGTALDAETKLEGQLSRLARLLVDRRLADYVSVRRVEDDDRLTLIVTAAVDPAVETALAALDEGTAPAREVLRTGQSVLVTDLPEEWPAGGADGEPEQERLRRLLDLRSGMVLPLTVRGRVLALLALGRREEAPRYTEDDRALGEEIAARAALSLDNALLLAEERDSAVRLALLQRVTADLSAASTPVQVAEASVGHVRQLLGDVAEIGFFEVDPQQRTLRRLAVVGSDTDGRWTEIPLATPLPLTTAVTEGRPLWPEQLSEPPADGQRPAWLSDPRDRLGVGATIVLPLRAFGRVVGVIGVGLATSRTVGDADRAMLLALAEQCAQALDRARLYRSERRIAETLQHSLLPQRLPRMQRMALATRYLPGAEGTQAGGDWYDVVELGESTVAIAVGDVVGQGPAAAAVMGQLRSALSSALLQGHGPAGALEVLDRFASRLPGATASSAACVLVDWAGGEIRWARAGHPPPLLVPAAGAPVRSLDDAGSGTVLGVAGRGPFAEGRATIAPGATLVLYTDGLVERRRQPIDDGIERLAGILHRGRSLSPEILASEVVERALAGSDQPDDVALIVARVLPPPIDESMPADPARLSALRRRVIAWGRAHALADETLEDLLLALGEAVSNSVEHAYRGRPGGTVDVRLSVRDDGSVVAEIRDFGRWRKEPADRGFRGRGLDMIRSLSADATVDHPVDDRGGTLVRFRVPPPPPGRPGTDLGRPVQQPRVDPPADGRLTVHAEDGGPRLAISGELDLNAATVLRPALLAEVSAVASGQEAVVDLRSTTYLASAGLGLLLEVADAARRAGVDLRVLATSAGVPARVLALAGLDTRLRPDRTRAR